MGRENKLFLRLCGVQRTKEALCICARAVCGCIRFAADRESAPTVVAGGLRWRERARQHEGMPPYVPA